MRLKLDKQKEKPKVVVAEKETNGIWHGADELKSLLKPISELNLDPQNARRHGDRNIHAVVESLRMFGQQKPIVVSNTGTIIAGNGTLLAAQELGWNKLAVTKFNGGDDVKARAYAIADNRTAELAIWDASELKSTLADLEKNGIDLDSLAFSEKELNDVLRDLGAKGDEIVEDEPPEPPAKPVTQSGDLWVLDAHRLLCGDSTKAEDVKRVLGDVVPFLMVTDPPYGVDYDPNWRNEADRANGKPCGARAVGLVTNDTRADWTDAYRLFPGSVAYVWHPAGATQGVFLSTLSAAGFVVRITIIWVKNNFPIGRGHYHVKHEPCFYAVRKGSTAKWCGDRSQTTTWEIDKPMKSETGHSTQKPVECMARPIRNHGDKADAVYDPFLGSGTTLIAAEQLSRRCFGIEIEPKYCDVIVKRWQSLTGKRAVNETRKGVVIA